MKNLLKKIASVLIILLAGLTLRTSKTYAKDLYYLALINGQNDEIDESQMPNRIEMSFWCDNYDKSNPPIEESITITNKYSIEEIVNILKKCSYIPKNEPMEYPHKYSTLQIDMYYDELTFISPFDNTQIETNFNVRRFQCLNLSIDGNYSTVSMARGGQKKVAEFDNTINELSKFFKNDEVRNYFFYDPSKEIAKIESESKVNENKTNSDNIINSSQNTLKQINDNTILDNNAVIDEQNKDINISNETINDFPTEESTMNNDNVANTNHFYIYIIILLLIILFFIIALIIRTIKR